MRVRVLHRRELGAGLNQEWVDSSRRPYIDGETVYVPVRAGYPSDGELPERSRYQGRGFQMVGDVALLHGPKPSPEDLEAIIRFRAPRGVLWVRSYLGTLRIPDAVLLYGSAGPVCHRENGHSYWLDPAQVMFAQGNREERARMGRLIQESGCPERIADLCAGIGYFTIPMATSGAHVHAMELNTVSYRYLEQNIAENHLKGQVVTSCGDCRELLHGTYDRMVLGHFESLSFLPAALRHAQPGSILHVHSIGSIGDEIRSLAAEAGFSAAVSLRRVKKYGPGNDHIVQDVVLS